MRVRELGDGEPAYTVIAGMHGDEPCGLAAIEALRAAESALQEPVRVVTANEPAVERSVRYLDTDLNRAFPGDPAGDAYEQRLAAELLDVVAGTTVLDLHSTRSCREPFAVVVDDHWELATATGTPHVVEAGFIGGGLLEYVDGVAVECGRLGTPTAAVNAVRITGRLLAAVGALERPAVLEPPNASEDSPARDGSGHTLPPVGREPTGYRIDGVVSGAALEFVGENFRAVDADETFARRDGAPVTADEPFVPVLMSTDGYADKLGYRASRLGSLSDCHAD